MNNIWLTIIGSLVGFGLFAIIDYLLCLSQKREYLTSYKKKKEEKKNGKK